jgi:HPt (histidine-containing phosphotransfer) domain-containing protein
LRVPAVTQGNGYAPLLDPSVLERLREELDDDEGVWKVFVQNFIAQLPERNEKLRQALTTGDVTGSMDAVLSLKTSCQMVGAERLAALAMDLEQALRHDIRTTDPAVALPHLAAAHLRRIKQCSRQTTYLLQAALKKKPDLG